MRRRASSAEERGFTIIEVLVVLIIVAILMTVAVLGLRTLRTGASAAVSNAAGVAVWSGIQSWRVDNGVFPPAAQVTQAGGAGLVDAADNRYVEAWPDGPDGSPITVTAGAGANPGGLSYVSGGNTATLRGWNTRGDLVFQRGVGAGGAHVEPIG